MAQAKHYIGYDGGNDVVVDPQALREIYVAPFEDAVHAGVSSIMCSYNKVNGPYACGSRDALTKLLKEEAGFRGFVTSDWGAVHSTLFVNEGLDLEMPGAAEQAPDMPMNQGFAMRSFFLSRLPDPQNPGAPGQRDAALTVIFRNSTPPEEVVPNAPVFAGLPGMGQGDPQPIGMLRAIESGQVGEAAVTAAAGRILYAMDRFGFLDKPPKHDVTAEDYASNAPVLCKTAEDSAVLLKNQGGVLPLSAADLESAVFIGPGAGQLVSIGLAGEKSMGIPEHQVGPAAAVERISGRKVVVALANDMTGVPVPATALSHDGVPGLLRTERKTNRTVVEIGRAHV